MDLPKVSFIIPIKNEEKTIGKCLDSLINLDYPSDKVEIIITEGKSTDKTREIVEEYAKKYSNIMVFDDPSDNKSTSRNICIKKSSGKFLMNYSGHVIAKKNLLKILISKFASNDIAGVGCPNLIPPDQKDIGGSVGILSTGFLAGGGTNTFTQNATFDKDKFVDHIPFVCYRRDIFEKIGYFDKNIQNGEDAEFNVRVKKSGYKILYTPETNVYLYRPSSLKKLFKKMCLYGEARTQIINKHPNEKNLFYTLAPIVFIIGPLCLFILYILLLYGGYIDFLFIALAIYFILCFASAISVSKNIKDILLSLIIYPIIHIGYSYGILREMVKS